jgi:hypothetical protein
MLAVKQGSFTLNNAFTPDVSILAALSPPSRRVTIGTVLAMLALAFIIFMAFPGRAVALAIGQFVTLTGKFRVMGADLVTGIGIQEAGAAGKIIAGPVKGPKANQLWWKIDFNSGPDGWVVQDLLAASSTAKPTVTLTASPASVAPGAATTLSWSTVNATACTGAGGAPFTGSRTTSGSIIANPTASTTYSLTCTGPGGTTTSTAAVAVTAGATTAPTVSLTASPTTISAGGTTGLTWASSNTTSCTASGTGFAGTRAVSGVASVQPTVTTTYAISCTGATGSASAAAVVTVTPAGTITAAAFANPDNGNIPDRALHPIAFPTAVGFGRVTSVRSPIAVVYKINSLDDVADPSDGKITYRECALALGVTTPYAIPAGRPRYCVFDVAGAISINSPAQITVPKIYIAGQTSPGGIEFRMGTSYTPPDSLIDTRSTGEHMILRHIRSRTGEHPTRPSDNGDPIRMSGTRYQILDHVSTMFGTDESLDMSCIDCTVQWSIIGPNICRNGGHSSSLHCKTFFLKPSSNITIAYNLSQHGEQRGINISVGVPKPTATSAGQADIINNVLYDYVAETGLVSEQYGDVHANYIGNVALRGPRYNPSEGNFLIGLYSSTEGRTFPFGFSIYANGNVTQHTRIAGQFGSTITDPQLNQAGLISNVLPGLVCGLNAAGDKDCSRIGKAVVQTVAPAIAPGNAGLSVRAAQIVSAEQAMRDVLAFAGADLCRDGVCRDNVDAMYIDDVRTCDAAPYLFETTWPSSVATAGGWAVLQKGTARTDTDNDGMPDDWERQFKNTNPAVWDANADADGDGYPNIEEYLNSLARDDARYFGQLGNGTGSLPRYNCNRAQFAVQ